MVVTAAVDATTAGNQRSPEIGGCLKEKAPERVSFFVGEPGVGEPGAGGAGRAWAYGMISFTRPTMPDSSRTFMPWG